MKLLFFILVSVANIVAQTSDSYEVLYDNLEGTENNETDRTLAHYVPKSFYNVSAHKANYFLPISYRMEDNFEIKIDDLLDEFEEISESTSKNVLAQDYFNKASEFYDLLVHTQVELGFHKVER